MRKIDMYGLESLHIVKLRNLDDVAITPSSGLNLIYGQNAQGKTSILEAIHLLSTGRILRGSRDSEAIQHQEENCFVNGVLIESQSKIGIELKAGKRKRVTLNGLNLPRASDIIGRLPSVCFWAGDLCLASGSPSDRRLFLDSELCQLYPSYLKALTTYKRALDQRNALLKVAQERSVAGEQFDVWEELMGPSGEVLRLMRSNWIDLVNVQAAQAQANLGQGEQLELKYLLKDETESLLDGFKKSRQLDIRRGTTTIGPQRDDLEILVEGKSVRSFGSQGQQRTSVISIKLSVLQVAQDTLKAPPVLLLDDIFSDLDESRRSRLVQTALELGGQVFITCTEKSQAGEEVQDRAKTYRVNSGTIIEE